MGNLGGPTPYPTANPDPGIAGALGVTPVQAPATATPTQVAGTVDPTTGLPYQQAGLTHGFVDASGVAKPAGGTLSGYGDASGFIDWNFLSSVLGFDAYVAYRQFTQAQKAAQSAEGRASLSRTTGEDLTTPSDWFEQSLGSQGSAGLMSLIDSVYSLTYGTALPDDLKKQIQASFDAMPPVARQQLTGELLATKTGAINGATAASNLISNPVVSGLISQYTAAHPTAATTAAASANALTAARNQFISQYVQTFGRAPTADQINAVSGMNAADYQQWFNEQPYKMGINYGDWNIASGKATSVWAKTFGRTPTANEIAHSAGMTDAQLQDWVGGMPSTRVKGMTVNEYNGSHDALSSVMQTEFGHDAPDELIKLFHWGSK